MEIQVLEFSVNVKVNEWTLRLDFKWEKYIFQFLWKALLYLKDICDCHSLPQDVQE